MNYESLILRPTVGTIDRDAITAWLAKQDYAYLDPVGQKVWHLSANKREMKRSRSARIADPKHFGAGVTIAFPPESVSPQNVSLNTLMALAAAPRALEFVQWLTREGEWDVQCDGGSFEPLGDPARLFPVGTGELDRLLGDVTEGVLHTWRANDRVFTVHTSGQWMLEANRKMWRGDLSQTALDEWEAAVAVARQSGDLVDFVEPDVSTGNLRAEDAEGVERSYFDASNIPDPLRPIAALVARWTDELSHWDDSSKSSDLLRVRRE